MVLYVLCYFPPNFRMIHSKMTRMQELRELDYGGLVLFSAGLILVMLGFGQCLSSLAHGVAADSFLVWGEGTYPWKSGHIIGALVSGGLTLIAFFLYGMSTYGKGVSYLTFVGRNLRSSQATTPPEEIIEATRPHGSCCRRVGRTDGLLLLECRLAHPNHCLAHD